MLSVDVLDILGTQRVVADGDDDVFWVDVVG